LWIDITTPLDDVFRQYVGHSHVVVFASGDPLFFGFATTIQKKLPQARVLTYPAFNSLQMLAHELTMPYHDMQVVSLTGRPWQEFDNALIRRTAKMGCADRTGSIPPCYYCRAHVILWLQRLHPVCGECFGRHNEEEQRYSYTEFGGSSKESFKHPNNLSSAGSMVKADPNFAFGISDRVGFELLPTVTKVITKAPLRLMEFKCVGASKTSFV
jgi:precorrin-6Y C5,15-methyltransferase (decarboxylating)